MSKQIQQKISQPFIDQTTDSTVQLTLNARFPSRDVGICADDSTSFFLK